MWFVAFPQIMKPVSIVPLLAFFLATTAHALTDREHLDKWCTQASSVAAGRCIGYLLAAEDALAHDSIEGVRACPLEHKSSGCGSCCCRKRNASL